MVKDTKLHRTVSPAFIIAFAFAAIILFGALLLMTPLASRDGSFTPPLDAFFTATSATCVTGLVTVDTASHYSIFGQCVILLLIQTGGLGFMSMAVMLSLLVRRTISPKERVLISQSYGLDTSGGTIRLMKKILSGTLCFEAAGALVLSLRFFFTYGNTLLKSIYRGIFVSVSAFCNAGFDPFGTKEAPFVSLTAFERDPTVLLTVSALIITGGIGFVVWDDILSVIKRKKRLGVYPKFVLILTALLLIFGTALFLLYEYKNPETLGKYSAGNKLLGAFFHSVTLRTAGFNTLNTAAMSEGSMFISIILMLIGGASGSTAGGIKVGTVGVILAAAVCAATGRSKVTVFKRRISREIIMRALSITVIGLTLVFVSGLVINSIDGVPLAEAIYETASAYATVGISVIGTPALGGISKLILMALMYIGRVGLLTVTFAVTVKMRDDTLINYPNINIPIG